MITKLAAGLFIALIALAIFLVWNPFNLKRDLASFTNIATIILAMATVISVFILAYQQELTSENSILDHRPYVTIDAFNTNNLGGYGVNLPENKTDEIRIIFPIKNVGKSIANDVRLQIDKAYLSKEMPEDLAELDMCFAESKIEIPKSISAGKISLYPEGKVPLQGARVSVKNLQSSLNNGSKLFLKISLDYDGPIFKKGTYHFHALYTVELEKTATGWGMLIMSSEENQSG